MAVSLSIKEVPDYLARALRDRAAANHRSIQGELMHILESALEAKPLRADLIADRLRALNFTTKADSLRTLRKDRGR